MACGTKRQGYSHIFSRAFIRACYRSSMRWLVSWILRGGSLKSVCLIHGYRISERSTWRWVFWSTSIVDGLIQVSGLFFLKESKSWPPSYYLNDINSDIRTFRGSICTLSAWEKSPPSTDRARVREWTPEDCNDDLRNICEAVVRVYYPG